MNRALLTLSLVVALAAWAGSPAPYKVVVNEKNPVTTLTRAQLSALFLKKTTTWDDGKPVLPLDLPDDAPARKAFSEDVLKKSISAVKSFWQQRIFSGRGVPPAERESEDEVLATLRSKDNAIGYVSGGTEVGASLKVVTITD